MPELKVIGFFIKKMAIKTSKKNLKIAGATSIALFSLVTVFTATIAWFSSNKRSETNGMAVKVNEYTGRLNKIEIYEYVETINKGTDDEPVNNFSFNSTPSATIFGGEGIGDKTFTLPDYDPLDPDHPILILFTLHEDFLSKKPGDMYINGATGVDGFLGTINGGVPKYPLGPSCPLTLKTKTVDVDDDGDTETVECYPLSSAVNFKCAHYSSDSFDELLDNSTSNRIDIPTSSITLRESFVNFATSGEGITFKKTPTIYSAPGGNVDIQYVAMVVNYDPNAISAIYSTYLGDTTLEINYGGRLFFTCDWALEVSV